MVHAVQAPKAETTQCTAQACVLQLRVSCWWSHGLPPVAGWVTLRLRLCVPVLQLVLHVVHAPQADSTQCPGHGCWLHALCSFRYGQAYPPKVAAVVTLRDLDCDPVPHDLVHVDHAPKDDTTQWPAQVCVLHALCSFRYGHA